MSNELRNLSRCAGTWPRFDIEPESLGARRSDRFRTKRLRHSQPRPRTCASSIPRRPSDRRKARRTGPATLAAATRALSFVAWPTSFGWRMLKERAGRVGSAGTRARLQQSGTSNAWVTPRAVATEIIPATAGAAHASECSRRRPEGEASTPGQKVWDLISYHNGTASEVAAVTSPAPSTAPSPSRLGSVPRGRRPGHSCRCRSSPARRKAR